MKLLITGASGFLGQYVVAEALRQGHKVKALMRSPASLSWANHSAVEIVQADLQKDRLANALEGVDAVIHLAAVMRGDYTTQYAGTVTATENLLNAMTQTGIDRLVAISTFSVFDYMQIAAGEIIDEDAPIEANPSQRDGYAQTKLIQEQRIRAFGQPEKGGRVTILRPSMIYGRDHLWNAHLGLKAGDRLWLQIGANGQMPITYVENCAEAIVLALQDSAIGQTLNIIDDNLPTQSAYVRYLGQQMASPPQTVAINWAVLQSLARVASQINAAAFRNRLKLPGLLVPARLHARFKPFRYSNSRAKQILGWQPRYSFVAAVERSCGSLDLLDVPPQPDQTPDQSPVVS
ncbi:NAD-dependent epimerase/dehydratase family protein [Phormidium tenue FACHB-886]|nr:NAD-dependent epimerase/dehydratase family protein [Phormidium tenue FACHB-886]